jgi:phytoene/squalene synthetase
MRNGLSPIELEHCREAALKPGSLFEFSSRYLPADQFDETLALYAVIQLIRSIPIAPIDDSVKWAKLKWWSEELAGEPDAASHHPVLKALWSTGARAKLDNALLLRLVSDSIMSIDVAPLSDEDAMFERLASSGTTEIELELALTNSKLDVQCLGLFGAASELLGVLSGLSVAHGSGLDHIPLSVLAKHNLNVSQLGRHPDELAQIVTQLAENGLNWSKQGLTNLDMSSVKRAGKHLQLRWALQHRRLQKISKDANKSLRAGIHFGPADALFAWRFLRRLN